MEVPFLDLRVTDPEERAELHAALDRCLDERIVLGPAVAEFEAHCAAACGSAHAVGVNSGTDALILGLRALALPPGSEVITTPLSFVATANAIVLNGLEPVFADIGDDLNLDPAAIEPLITDRTRAILPVHFGGKMCDLAAIGAIAQRHGLLLVEDASQAFGAERDGKRAGSVGVMGCISLNPMKILAALGEAGVVTTNDPHLAERLQTLRYHGLRERDVCVTLSHNGRLDTLQAAFLLTRLARLEERIARRRANAADYTERLAEVVGVPHETPNGRDVWFLYVIRTPQRAALQRFLAQRGIETKVHDPRLMPQQPIHQGRRGHFPRAAALLDQLLCLPVHEKLTPAQRDHVVASVRAFFAGEGRA